jgi:antitoxin ParD1/3/4
MRTNIDIDDAIMDAAMRAGPFKTKKDAVDAGLKLLARQAAYREILKWEGKLRWDGDAEDPPSQAAMPTLHTGTALNPTHVVNEARTPLKGAAKPPRAHK